MYNPSETINHKLHWATRFAKLSYGGDHRLSSAVFSHQTTLFAGRMEAEGKVDEFLVIVSPISEERGHSGSDRDGER